MSNPKISILLPAYKSKGLLDKVFLRSFWENTKKNCEVIVYDNGDNGYSMPGIKINGEHQSINGIAVNNLSIKVIGDGNNIGLNKALNACAKIATGDYFYLPHTDMYLLPGWDTALLEACKNLPPASFLLCSRSIEKFSHTPFHVLRDFGTSLETFKEKELLQFFKDYDDKGIVTGNRMPFFGDIKLVKKLQNYNVANKICDGPFDDSFWSYATDNDLFFNCYDIGVRRFWVVQASVVYHLSGQSNKQQTVDKDDKKPYIKLCEKWKKYNVTMNIDESENRLVPWNLKIK